MLLLLLLTLRRGATASLRVLLLLLTLRTMLRGALPSAACTPLLPVGAPRPKAACLLPVFDAPDLMTVCKFWRQLVLGTEDGVRLWHDGLRRRPRRHVLLPSPNPK